MKTVSLVMCLMWCNPTSAVLHPVLLDPVITSCRSGEKGPCTLGVNYRASGLSLTDITPLAPPLLSSDLDLVSMGVHCVYGNGVTGTPFQACYWEPSLVHSPPLADGCRLLDRTSWELDPKSTCSLKVTTWGAHDGAGPGGECVMFVQKPIPAGGQGVPIRTIYGDLTALQVANAGSTFCQKALPPAQKCEIDLPAVIDHGTIGTTDHSVVNVDGTVDCGAKPVITVLGGNTVTLGDGVASELTLHQVDEMHVRVTSTVTSTDAVASDYNGTHVVIASPY